MTSVTCFRAIIPAVNVARMELQWALELQALESSSVVLANILSIARRLGKGSTSVAETLQRTCEHGVLWVEGGLEVRTIAIA